MPLLVIGGLGALGLGAGAGFGFGKSASDGVKNSVIILTTVIAGYYIVKNRKTLGL